MMENVYTHFPQVKKKHHMLLDMDHLALPKGFQAKFMKNETVSPSSGWLGVQHSLHQARSLPTITLLGPK